MPCEIASPSPRSVFDLGFRIFGFRGLGFWVCWCCLLRVFFVRRYYNGCRGSRRAEQGCCKDSIRVRKAIEVRLGFGKLP